MRMFQGLKRFDNPWSKGKKIQRYTSVDMKYIHSNALKSRCIVYYFVSDVPDVEQMH